MTRRARSGNTQKHQKIPLDATPWENLKPTNNEDDTGNGPMVKSPGGKTPKAKQSLGDRKVSFQVPGKNTPGKNQKDSFVGKKQLTPGNKGKTALKKFQGKKANGISEEEKKRQENKNSKLRYKRKRKGLNKAEEKSLSPIISEKLSSVITADANPEILTDTKQSMAHQEVEQSALSSNETSPPTKKKKLKNGKQSMLEDSVTTNKTHFISKKEMFLARLRKERAEKGIMLLSPKAENKIYKIKRALRRKGTPPEIIKEIARKVRREEELKFRKLKPCLNCRKIDHLIADCPAISQQEKGMCLKCGSTEHTSFKCSKKHISGFPLAKCFICKELGHISRECPQNSRGIYPRGGQCHNCGNINHLKKDCPRLVAQKADEDATISLYTLNKGSSVDEEILNDVEKINEAPKKKIVKF